MVVLVRISKPVLFACISYLPGDNRGKLNRPSLSEVTEVVEPLSMLMRRTTTACKTAPVGSSVTPVSAPVEGVWPVMLLGNDAVKARIARIHAQRQYHRRYSYKINALAILAVQGTSGLQTNAFIVALRLIVSISFARHRKSDINISKLLCPCYRYLRLHLQCRICVAKRFD